MVYANPQGKFIIENCQKFRGNTKVGNNTNKARSNQVLKKFRIIYGSVRQHFREVEQACGVSGSQLWLMQEIANTPDIGVS